MDNVIQGDFTTNHCSAGSIALHYLYGAVEVLYADGLMRIVASESALCSLGISYVNVNELLQPTIVHSV